MCQRLSFCRRLRIGVGSALIQVTSGLIGRFEYRSVVLARRGMVVEKKCGKLFGNEWRGGFGKGNEQFVFASVVAGGQGVYAD